MTATSAPDKGTLLGGEPAEYATTVTYAQTFAARDCDDLHTPCSIAYLHIESPSLEEWTFQPYYYQYQNAAPQNQVSDFRSQTLTGFTCIFWSRDSTKTLDKPGECVESDALAFPGSIAKAVKITVTGS